MTVTNKAGEQSPPGLRGRRAMPAIAALLLATTLSGCGGSDAEAEAASEPSATTAANESQTTTPTEANEPEAATTTEAIEEEPAPAAGVSTATVNIAGETYTFGATGFIIEQCNPDFFGGAQVVLQMVDENGEGMVIDGQIRPVNIALIPNDPGSTAVSVPTTDPDREWIAEVDSMIVEGSQVDDWSIDANRVQGTATFVSTAGEGPEQGTFEAICIEE